MVRPRGFESLVTRALAVLGLCGACVGDTLYVDDDAPDDPGGGDPSISDPLEDGTSIHPFDAIQEAINAAVAGDVVLVADGFYSGDLNRDMSLLGLAITVRSENGPDVTVIDAGGDKLNNHRAFVLDDGETPKSVVEGFLIQNGYVAAFPSLGLGAAGGAVLITAGSPTFLNCRFVSNTVLSECGIAEGGAVHVDDGAPTFTGCVFSGNQTIGSDCASTTQGYGGAISAVNSNLVVTDCHFEANEVEAASTGAGGAVFNSGGNPEIRGCVFESNTAFADDSTASGAGVAVSGALSVVVDRCEFRSCTADGFSGATGGGLSIAGTTGTVSNCLFEENEADGLSSAGSGGGLAASDGVLVVNCTFSGNRALGDPSVGDALSAGPGTTVANSVFWTNPGTAPTDIGGDPAVSFSNVEGGYPGPGNIDVDPLFVDAGTGDFRLQAGSPCIDAGDNTEIPAGITEDLAGNPRIVDNPTSDSGFGSPPFVDMGAYERPRCTADMDGDGGVAIGDLLLIVGQWGPCPPGCFADVNGDGVVGINDLLEALASWGPCP